MQTLETKVLAAGAGAGAGSIISGFIIWVLGVLVWHQSYVAANAVHAAEQVPLPVAGLVGLFITVGSTVFAGYSAPHTFRSDVTPPDTGALPVQGNFVDETTQDAPAAVVNDPVPPQQVSPPSQAAALPDTSLLVPAAEQPAPISPTPPVV